MDDRRESTRRRIQEAAAAIETAAMLMRAELAFFDEYAREAARMDSVGPILDPTLFMNAKRQAVDAMLRPIFSEAAAFVRSYDAHVARSRAALEKVMGGADG